MSTPKQPRFNALKHGIHAETQIMFDETVEDLELLTAEYLEQFPPSNPNERFLADTLIHNEWRLRRLRRVEAEIWDIESNRLLDAKDVPTDDESVDNVIVSSGETFCAAADKFVRLQRVVNCCERSYHRALKELNRLQARQEKVEQVQSPAADLEPKESKRDSGNLVPFRQIPQSRDMAPINPHSKPTDAATIPS